MTDIRERVARDLHRLFDSVLDEPVPQDMLDTLKEIE
jgi:hypothetical protein